MRHTPRYLMTDPEEGKRLIRAHPWAAFVSPVSAGLVASHYPVLLDEDEDDIVLVSQGDLVPTWNHVTAHLSGTPEILTAEENDAMLTRLTDHFEGGQPHGRSLADDEPGTRRAAKGTVGLRLRVARFDAVHPALAAEMRRV